MPTFRAARFFILPAFALLLAALTLCAAQSQDQSPKPLPLKPQPSVTSINRRLILKDGSYQVVRKYEIAGDRVRYISVERGGDWEELPYDLVDWDATHKWERDHASQPAEEPSPAMKEAEEVDKEEADERNEQKARRPEVAKGLELPDEDAVFALDSYAGAPELVELLPVDLTVSAKNRHGLRTLNPLAGAMADLEMEGAHAKVHLHVGDPAIYLALASREQSETVLTHALTVDTGKAKEIANRKHGAHSPSSGFAIVRASERNTVRVVGAIHVSPSRAVTQDEDVMPAKVEVLHRQALAQDHAGKAACTRRVCTGGDPLRRGDRSIRLGLLYRPAIGGQRAVNGADRQVEMFCRAGHEILASFYLRADRRTARICRRARHTARLNRGDSAIRMAAQADDLHSVSDALAVVAAILLLFRCKAGAGRIRALLGSRHNPPLPVRSAPF